jgi:RNA polymerase sigma-70 factor (ECF subfamily)
MTARPSTEAVWSQLSNDLRRFIRRRVADDQTADDLLQETFIRIHRGIASLDNAERLLPWVYQIARNIVHDHYRAKPETVEPLGDTDPAADRKDRFDGSQCRCAEWTEELIGQLPETYREAIRLSEVEGLSQQEIADRLGLSLSGAKSRVQRGRAMLREVLDRCCHFEFDRRGNLLDIDPKPDRQVCKSCDDSDLI